MQAERMHGLSRCIVMAACLHNARGGGNKYAVIRDLIHQKRTHHTLEPNDWLGLEIDHLLNQIHQPDSIPRPLNRREYMLGLTPRCLANTLSGRPSLA